MMPQSTYHHGDLRAAVLDRAEAALIQDPRHSLSVRALAAEIGVSPTAPHAHFKTRTDLLAALAARGFDRLRAETLLRSATVFEPRAKLAALAEAYLEFSIANAGLYRLMFATGVDLEAQPALRAAAKASYAVLEAAVDEALPNLSEDERRKRSLAAWGIVHGFASLLSEDRMSEDVRSGLTMHDLSSIAADLIAGSAST